MYWQKYNLGMKQNHNPFHDVKVTYERHNDALQCHLLLLHHVFKVKLKTEILDNFSKGCMTLKFTEAEK